MDDPNANSNWTTVGWFTVQPGKFATVIAEPLKNRYVYFYATTKDSKFVWSGNMNVCVSYSKFRYYDGFAYRNGRPECHATLKFVLIDTKNETEFTQSLSCEGNSYNDYLNRRETGNPVYRGGSPKSNNSGTGSKINKNQSKIYKAIDYVRLNYVDKGMKACVAEVFNLHPSKLIIVDVYSKTDNTLYDRVRVEPMGKEGVTASMCFASCMSADCKKTLYIKSARFED